MFEADGMLEVNAMARFRVRVAPDAEALEAAPFREQRLFCWAPLPGAIDCVGSPPESVRSDNALLAGTKTTAHAFTALGVELNRTDTLDRSAAPLESEN
jgi:hypothetical protein